MMRAAAIAAFLLWVMACRGAGGTGGFVNVPSDLVAPLSLLDAREFPIGSRHGRVRMFTTPGNAREVLVVQNMCGHVKVVFIPGPGLTLAALEALPVIPVVASPRDSAPAAQSSSSVPHRDPPEPQRIPRTRGP